MHCFFKKEVECFFMDTYKMHWFVAFGHLWELLVVGFSGCSKAGAFQLKRVGNLIWVWGFLGGLFIGKCNIFGRDQISRVIRKTSLLLSRPSNWSGKGSRHSACLSTCPGGTEPSSRRWQGALTLFPWEGTIFVPFPRTSKPPIHFLHATPKTW